MPVKTRQDLLRRLLSTSVKVPNMTGTASAASTGMRSIPMMDSTVGREALVAGTALAPVLGPAAVANEAAVLGGEGLGAVAGKAALDMGIGLLGYGAVDRVPYLWNGDRLSETAGDVAEKGVRYVMPDGRAEDVIASGARLAAPFLLMGPEAVAGMAIEQGIRSGAKAISGKVEKKLADLAAKKDWRAFKQYAKDNGLGIATDTETGKPVLMSWQGPMYLKDGKLEPVEGLDVAGSAALKPQDSLESAGFSSGAWENWLAGHENFFSKAAGYPSSPATAFKYVPDYEADIIGDQAEAAGLSAQEYWKIMAEANAKHKADPTLKYKHLKKEDFPNLSENQFNSIIDESVSKDITPEQTYLNLSYENGKLASVPPKPSVGWHKTYTEIDPTDYSYLSNSDIQTLLDEYAKLGYTPQEAEKYLIAENTQAHVNLLKKTAKTPSGSPVFEEHGPWEMEYPALYPDSASDMPINIGHVWNKPYIRVSQPKRQSLDEIEIAAKEGRIAPLQTTVTDVFGMPAQVSEDWAANLLTEEGKRQAPNGLLYAWKGNPGHALFPGRAGKYGDPYWSDVYMGNYKSLFSAEHDLAKTYTGPGYSEASHIDYSTAGGAPNLMLLAYPKQPIYDTGIDLAGMHWNKLFDPTPENIALYRKLLAEADAKGIKPYQVSGPIADDYHKMLSTNPFSLKGWGNFRSVDEISSFLDGYAPDFGYNGVLMRNLEDNASGTGGHGEFIWTPKHGGYPKAVHPANTLDLDWSVDNYLRKNGGKIHIKPENRGKFTALMKRTGKPASWFKAHGTPAQRKMATFALNARHWKHEDGGPLDVYGDTLLQYPDGGRIRGRRNGKYFVTELGDKKEQKFQDWYADTAAILGLDPNPDAYEHAYDYRGYWLNNRNADISSPDFHFPDTWKQPHHPTFSNESVYAKGIDGVGHWEGDTFVPGYFNNIMRSTDSHLKKEEEPVVDSNYVPSEDILNYIKDTEAFRGDWYQDGNGVWTIGYGFTGDDVRRRFPNGMTQAEADQYFADTVSRRIPQFMQATPNFDKLNQNQRDALFSYYYNIGHGGYTRKSPTMQQALKDMDLDTVVNNIDFGYNDRKNRGLRKRRDYERNLFTTPMDYGGILNRLRTVYGDNESVKAAILRAKNVKKQ